MEDSLVISDDKPYLPFSAQDPPDLFNVWINYPDLCVNLTNFVSTAKLDKPVDLQKIFAKYPYCEILQSNLKRICLPSQYPYRHAKLYDYGLISFTGNATFRESRAIADRYLELIRDADQPDVNIATYSLSNIGCLMNFDFVLDIEEYNKDKPDAIYDTETFVGSRLYGEPKRLVSHACVTTFKRNINIVNATNDRDVCFDIERLYYKYAKHAHAVNSEKGQALLVKPEKKKRETGTRKRKSNTSEDGAYKKRKTGS